MEIKKKIGTPPTKIHWSESALFEVRFLQIQAEKLSVYCYLWCRSAFLTVCSAEPQGSAKDAQGLRSRRLVVPTAPQSPKIYPLKSTKN
jgi:hypothetical protein